MQAALIGALPATLLALASIVVQWYQAKRTRAHDSAQAALARQHELRVQRMPDLRAASSAFATLMREINDEYLSQEAERGLAFPAIALPPDGDNPPREEPAAERLLQELELVAGEDVVSAARRYLEEHLMHWWGPADEGLERPVDLDGARARFFDAVKVALYGAGA